MSPQECPPQSQADSAGEEAAAEEAAEEVLHEAIGECLRTSIGIGPFGVARIAGGRHPTALHRAATFPAFGDP